MSYGINQIEVYKGLEGVRARPEMYIGDRNVKGYHHILWEVIDNAIDEHVTGYGNSLKVTITKEGFAVVEDRGRGIPFEIHPETQKSGVETILTMLHAGGKMGKADGYGSKGTGGTHGVGVSVTNALSSKLVCKVWRDRKCFTIIFEKGECIFEDVVNESRLYTGTEITFKPDAEIFGDELQFEDERIIERLYWLTYLNKIDIEYKNEITGKKIYIDGFEDGFSFGASVLAKGSLFPEPFVFENEQFRVAFTVTSHTQEKPIMSFVNNCIPTPKGGSHESGVKQAFVRFFNSIGSRKLDSNDIMKYSFTMIAIRYPDVAYTSQHKEELARNDQLAGKIQSFMYQELTDWYSENPNQVREVLATLQKRLDAEKEPPKEDKSKIKIQGSAKKITHARIKDPSKNELFLVEGDSAGGTAKQGKDDYQAILPLRGKVLNAISNPAEKVFNNEEIKSLIIALGGNYGDNFNPEKCPYARVIIMTDADSDGAHIATLLLAFMYTYYYKLIEAGMLFLACPPLYRVEYRKKMNYFFSQEDANEFTKDKRGFTLKRFKGLGEMDATALKSTTMNPRTRRLIQLSVDDYELGRENLERLMGSSSSGRKELLDEIFN